MDVEKWNFLYSINAHGTEKSDQSEKSVNQMIQIRTPHVIPSPTFASCGSDGKIMIWKKRHKWTKIKKIGLSNTPVLSIATIQKKGGILDEYLISASKNQCVNVYLIDQNYSQVMSINCGEKFVLNGIKVFSG